MKKLLVTLIAASLTLNASADDKLVPPQTVQCPSTQPSKITLGTTQDLPSLELVETTPPIPLSYRATDAAAVQWLKTGVASELIGTNGAVMYAYGQSRPTITCAPLHICTITLLDDEHITNVSIGDSVRWLVQPTNAGNRPVIVVKPTVSGVITNLVVTTDAGRIYYMTLASKRADYVPLVGFYDPQKLVINLQQQANQAAATIKAKVEQQQETIASSLGNVDPATLDFNYTCDNVSNSIKPVRVFSGNGHTYMQMPADMKYTDAPAVFNTSGSNTELMNSRLVHGYYVIDGVPSKFKLVLGVGNNAVSEQCTHSKSSSWFH